MSETAIYILIIITDHSFHIIFFIYFLGGITLWGQVLWTDGMGYATRRDHDMTEFYAFWVALGQYHHVFNKHTNIHTPRNDHKYKNKYNSLMHY